VQVDEFDEAEFFRAIAESGARILLIGRRALVVIGIPVLTSDYDFWLASDDVEKLNAALSGLDMVPNREPAEARRVGRYVVENGERVDVLIARQVPTQDGTKVLFDDVYARSELVTVTGSATVRVPCIADLILTKQFGARPKDLADIDLLKAFAARRAGTPR
jgi:hypothetical protein